VIVVSSTDIAVQQRGLLEKGFAPIGHASFRGGSPTRNKLLEQSKKVGADVVLYSSEYSHTERGVNAVTRYDPGQTYTTTSYGSATANVYGGGYNAYGNGSYSGYKTTTTPGTVHTDYVPYERQVHDCWASFWRRTKPGIIGVHLKPIPDELRAKLQRNAGAYVEVVVLDGAAFKANIMRGDVIIQIADKPVSVIPEIQSVLRAHAGEKVPVKLIRDNRTIDLEVQLNPAM
jgi:hypothetical protein